MATPEAGASRSTPALARRDVLSSAAPTVVGVQVAPGRQRPVMLCVAAATAAASIGWPLMHGKSGSVWFASSIWPAALLWLVCVLAIGGATMQRLQRQRIAASGLLHLQPDGQLIWSGHQTGVRAGAGRQNDSFIAVHAWLGARHAVLQTPHTQWRIYRRDLSEAQWRAVCRWVVWKTAC